VNPNSIQIHNTKGITMKASMGIALAAMLLLFAGAATADETPTFESACKDVSVADGVPADAIDGFCSCLAAKAAADEALGSELSAAAASEPDAARRMELLSDGAKEAVGSCQATHSSQG
jgi:hypothetical protein